MVERARAEDHPPHPGRRSRRHAHRVRGGVRGQEPNDEPNSTAVIFKANALYDYNAEEGDELSFAKGDVLRVTEEDEDGEWWTGTNERTGETGTFPANHVERIPDEEEP